MKLNNKTIGITVLFVWVIITLIRVFYHQPWYDEAHAWLIAHDYSFMDVIAFMKYEGHTFLRYLLLMPFAKNDFLYPYSMLFINWIFAFGAVVLFWYKSPFNLFTKICVIFSYGFLSYFPIIARCYSVGVFLLFLLTSLYSDRLKRPILYSFIILCCANTSVVALFGATAFGAVFWIDLIKNYIKDNVITRKIFIISNLILALTGILILWQLGSANAAFISPNSRFLYNFNEFIQTFFPTVTIAGQIAFLISVLLVLYLSVFQRRVLFIFLFTFAGLIYIFAKVYGGGIQHYLFFFIYLLIALWLLEDKVKNKILSTVEIFVGILFFCQIFSANIFYMYLYHSKSKDLANLIKQYSNGRIVLLLEPFKMSLPYLAQEQRENIYFYCTGTIADVNSTLYETPLCRYNDVNLNITWLKKSLSKNEDNYVVALVDKNRPLDTFVLTDKFSKIQFEPETILKNVYVLYKLKEIR